MLNYRTATSTITGRSLLVRNVDVLVRMAKRKAHEEDKILKDLGQFQITRDTPRLSELEEQVLGAYDELEELRLERVLLESSQKAPKRTSVA